MLGDDPAHACTGCRKDLVIETQLVRLKSPLWAYRQSSACADAQFLSMRRNKLALYVHLVWATWDRLPLITPSVEHLLHHVIGQEVVKHGCAILAINGIEDHVHLLIALPTTVVIATLVSQAKGA